jgi:hypothetical protein
MALHQSNSFHFVDIPDLDFADVGAEGEVGAFDGPGYGSYCVGCAEVAEFCHFGVVGIPEVDT